MVFGRRGRRKGGLGFLQPAFWRCLLGSATIWGNRCMSGDGFALGAHTQSEHMGSAKGEVRPTAVPWPRRRGESRRAGGGVRTVKLGAQQIPALSGLAAPASCHPSPAEGERAPRLPQCTAVGEEAEMDCLRPEQTLPTLPRPWVWGQRGHCDHESLYLLDFHLLFFIRAYPSQEITERGELDGFNELIIVPKTSK